MSIVSSSYHPQEANDPHSAGATSSLLDGEVEMRDDVANRMSLFYAHPTPLLNALSTATKKFVEMVSPTHSVIIVHVICVIIPTAH